MRYTQEQYINDIDFGDRDVDVSCSTVKMVKCRKEHSCHFSLIDGEEHIIKKGEIARHETALVDHEFWGSYYVCVPCMDKWISSINGEECDQCKFYDFDNETDDGAKCLNKNSNFHNQIVAANDTCELFKWEE